MKKNGFTLIELLAVIIILSIIVLITVISVNSTISDTKSSLSETQIKRVEGAAKSYYLKEGMNIDDKCINVSELIEKGYVEGNNVLDPKTKEEMTGSVKIIYASNQYSYEYQEDVCLYSNGEVVYFDVKNGVKCTQSEYNVDNSLTGYNGITTTTANQTSCLKFYAFNDSEDNERLNLLLDHNTAKNSMWHSMSNLQAPAPALSSLQSSTLSWIETETPQNYASGTYTISYSNYNARLITANEVAQITGNTSWNESTSTTSFYFDSNLSTSSTQCTTGNLENCNYGWLYDRTSTSCKTYGCLNNADSEMNTSIGYWTASAYPSTSNNTLAWLISNEGKLSTGHVNYGNSSYGIRPVIEVLKTKLK